MELASTATKQTELWLNLSEEDKLLPVMSYSQLMMLVKCEYAFWMGYTLGYEDIEKPRTLSVGSLVHEGLQEGYTQKLLQDMPLSYFGENHLQSLTEKWLGSGQESLQYAAHATWMLSRYFAQADEMDAGHTVLAVEHHFLIKVHSISGRPFLLQGYVDLVTRDRAGRVWIWDHKTGQKLWTAVEVAAESQLPLYCIALREEALEATGTIINCLNSYDYKNKEKVLQEQLFKRDPLPRSDQELQSIGEDLLSLADDWLDAKAGRWRHGKPVRTQNRDNCKYCRFNDPCLTSLKGIPVEIILEQSFKKKEKKPTPSSIQLEGFEI